LAANRPEFLDPYLKANGVKPGQLKPGQMARGYFRNILGRCTEPPNDPTYQPTGGPRPTRPLSDLSTYRCEPMDDDMGSGQDLGTGTPRVLFDRAATQYLALGREMYPDLYRDKAASSGEVLGLLLILGGLVALASGNGATSPDANAEADRKEKEKEKWNELNCKMIGGQYYGSGLCYPPRPRQAGGGR
jgi:hypothetical protein